MSTIHNINGDMAAAASATVLQPTDYLAVYQASSNTHVKMTGSQVTGGNAAVVAVTAGATTLTVTQAAHGNRVIQLNNTAPIAITLPQATGTGTKYTFYVSAAATGTASTISVANGTDVMQGVAWMLTTGSDNVIGFKTSATSDRISINGTTQGGVAGDKIEIIDVKTGFFRVDAFLSPTGSYATGFSASVS